MQRDFFLAPQVCFYKCFSKNFFLCLLFFFAQHVTRDKGLSALPSNDEEAWKLILKAWQYCNTPNLHISQIYSIFFIQDQKNGLVLHCSSHSHVRKISNIWCGCTLGDLSSSPDLRFFSGSIPSLLYHDTVLSNKGKKLKNITYKKIRQCYAIKPLHSQKYPCLSLHLKCVFSASSDSK